MQDSDASPFGPHFKLSARARSRDSCCVQATPRYFLQTIQGQPGSVDNSLFLKSCDNSNTRRPHLAGGAPHAPPKKPQQSKISIREWPRWRWSEFSRAPTRGVAQPGEFCPRELYADVPIVRTAESVQIALDCANAMRPLCPPKIQEMSGGSGGASGHGHCRYQTISGLIALNIASADRLTQAAAANASRMARAPQTQQTKLLLVGFRP